MCVCLPYSASVFDPVCVCACVSFLLPHCPSSFPPQDPCMYCDLCLESPWFLQVCLLLSSDDTSSVWGSPIYLTSSPPLSSPCCFSNIPSKFLLQGLCPGCFPCLEPPLLTWLLPSLYSGLSSSVSVLAKSLPSQSSQSLCSLTLVFPIACLHRQIDYNQLL